MKTIEHKPAPKAHEWISGYSPDIPKGEAQGFWVTHRNKNTGKLSVAIMYYHNAHVMPLSEHCDDPPDCAVPHGSDDDGYCEDYEWTGWSRGHCEHCEADMFVSDEYTNIIAHMPAPEPFEGNYENNRT